MAKELKHDAVTKLLHSQISDGIAEISAANEILLAQEDSTSGVREIDKALKDGTDNEAVDKAFAVAQELKEKFRAALDEARNLYRVEVLKEEAQAPTADVDKDAVKETRKNVMGLVNMAVTYAKVNNKSDILEWAQSLEIPQVGRQGTSTVGSRKPRAYVSVNGERFDSFGEAAKKVSETLSTEDTEVAVSSGDLVKVWTENNDAAEFDFQGVTITVQEKEKKAA